VVVGRRVLINKQRGAGQLPQAMPPREPGAQQRDALAMDAGIRGRLGRLGAQGVRWRRLYLGAVCSVQGRGRLQGWIGGPQRRVDGAVDKRARGRRHASWFAAMATAGSSRCTGCRYLRKLASSTWDAWGCWAEAETATELAAHWRRRGADGLGTAQPGALSARSQ
jgi:hypothetical protein